MNETKHPLSNAKPPAGTMHGKAAIMARGTYYPRRAAAECVNPGICSYVGAVALATAHEGVTK